jgi:transposase
METITTIGLDIAKSVFQVHGVDAQGKVIVRRQLKRRYVLAFFQKLPPCLVGIEACASSHYWSRELQALGHTVRLMPPAYVKPYVKRQKNDSTDAEAICEAVTRANMRFVPTKTTEQQSCLMLHRTRHLFIRQQTAVINAIRAHFAMPLAPTVTPAKGRGLRVGLGLSVLPGPTSLSHRRPSFDPLHIAKGSLTSLPPLIRATVKGKCGVGLVDCTPLKADAALKSETPRFTKPTTKVRLAPAFGPLL